jgi:hypothetical protein
MTAAVLAKIRTLHPQQPGMTLQGIDTTQQWRRSRKIDLGAVVVGVAPPSDPVPFGSPPPPAHTAIWYPPSPSQKGEAMCVHVWGLGTQP